MSEAQRAEVRRKDRERRREVRGSKPRKRKVRELVGPVARRVTPLPERHPVRLLAARPEPPKDWWVTLVSGRCGWCAEPFVAGTTRHDNLPRYCSKSCASQAGKYARGRFLIADTKRQEIYERDGWVCQLPEICPVPDGRVDPDLDPSDRWAATLDHIIPRSHMLIPDDSPENLQLAHRWCNSMKGDGSRLLAV